MQFKGRQSTNVIDLRKPRDINTPVREMSTLVRDATVVSPRKVAMDRHRALTAANPVSMLSMYRPKKRPAK